MLADCFHALHDELDLAGAVVEEETAHGATETEVTVTVTAAGAGFVSVTVTAGTVTVTVAADLTSVTVEATQDEAAGAQVFHCLSALGAGALGAGALD